MSATGYQAYPTTNSGPGILFAASPVKTVAIALCIGALASIVTWLSGCDPRDAGIKDRLLAGIAASASVLLVIGLALRTSRQRLLGDPTPWLLIGLLACR
jgi:hypothetical protein